MDKTLSEFGTNYVPENYLTIALDARKSREKKFRLLLEKKKLPDTGWEDCLIEEFINYLSSLDSNNFPIKCGLGEREARIVCGLVARRHYNFGHGIGRSGDLLESQPKAAGSTLLSHLTNALLLDLIRSLGIQSIQSCFLVPMATGMTINLCFLSLRRQRPTTAKYILWSRIDQKSCFKCIITAGFIPVIIETIPENDLIQNYNGLQTNLKEFEKQIELLKSENILCIYSTTSCFAPRLCDNIIELSKLSKKYNIPHVINNAYGLQSSYLLHQIQNGQNQGRIDLFIQSTDKNLLVPVGGAIVAGFDKEIVENVSKSYVGRASSSQSLDVLMTLLSLGLSGYKKLIFERKSLFLYLKESLNVLANKYDEIIYETKNPISIAMTLKNICENSNNECTKLGSMLFTRGVSGARIITTIEKKIINDYEFNGWGSHKNNSNLPYLTVAASLGLQKNEIDEFLVKLDKCMVKMLEKNK